MKLAACLTLTVLCTWAVSGCKKKPEATPPSAEQVAAITAKLVKADALDGATDHVVAKCAGCKLGMDGKEAHALAAHGYALHFCSDGCKTHFAEDLDQSLLALEIPKE